MDTDFDVVIVGGGLAGLVSAIELAGDKKKILLIEKKHYPYHKVCGEYISNEVLGYIQSLGLDPFLHGAARIEKLRISTPVGKNIYTQLDMGGFSLSRYVLDYELSKLAQIKGAIVLTDTRVVDIEFINNKFTVKTNGGEQYTAKLVIGSYGKRETLDKKLERPFVSKRTGYMAVKYHILTDYPSNEIGLDNFENGYCGISKIEGNTFNLCYLYKRNDNNSYKSIQDLEEAVLYKNPVLKNIFLNADFVYDAPLTINEINFGPKSPVAQHVLMCGDSAGLITPLCGNGMSMAIGGAKLLCELIHDTGILNKTSITEAERHILESRYTVTWNTHFKSRLFWGRAIQKLLGNPALTGTFLRTVHKIPLLEQKLIQLTHGKAL